MNILFLAKNANTNSNNAQTGWKSSKYVNVNTDNQEKENNLTQSQIKNTEESKKLLKIK